MAVVLSRNSSASLIDNSLSNIVWNKVPDAQGLGRATCQSLNSTSKILVVPLAECGRGMPNLSMVCLVADAIVRPADDLKLLWCRIPHPDHALHNVGFALHRYWFPVLYRLLDVSCCLEKLLWPGIILALGYALLATKLDNRILAAKSNQNNTDVVFGRITPTCLAVNIFHRAISSIRMVFGCMCHSSFLFSEDEPKMLSKAIGQICSIGVGGKHSSFLDRSESTFSTGHWLQRKPLCDC